MTNTAAFEEKEEPDQSAYEEARELVHSIHHHAAPRDDPFHDVFLQVEGADDIIEELDERWMRLFCDTLEAERFQKFDMAEILAKETTVCVPPWYGTTKPREEEEEDEEAVLELRSICDHHDNQRRTVDLSADTDEHERNRGRIESEGEGTRDEARVRRVGQDTNVQRCGMPSARYDAARHDTAPMAPLLQTLLIPSESPVVRAMRETGQCPREVQAAGAQRKETWDRRLRRVARDCLCHLTPPPDTVQPIKGLQ